MIFRQLYDHTSFTYTYLLGDESTREAILIDPVIDQVDRDLQLIKELDLTLTYTLETHVHADHITGSGRLRDKTGCHTGVAMGAEVDCADVELTEADVINFGGNAIAVIETPGHTPASVSYLTGDRVFTGDSLLIRGCGRTDFQGGDAGILYDVITNKLFQLDDQTLVYPGHDYRGLCCSTIGEEKLHNPRLALNRPAFIEFMNQLDLPDPGLIHEALPANLACGDD